MSQKLISMVVIAGVVRHSGDVYEIDETLDVSEKDAEHLKKAGAAKYKNPRDEKASADSAGEAEQQLDDVVEAIGQLDPNNEDHWTQANLPEVGALKEILGRNVTGAERDAAWEQYQEEAE
jgi:hypothetical protein